jgi:hypothetical protein
LLSALILRLPDILQFIGLGTVIVLMGILMWKSIRFWNRVANRTIRK